MAGPIRITTILTTPATCVMLFSTPRSFGPIRSSGLIGAAAVAIVSTVLTSTALACPFCTAVSQTLRQEMAGMDAVVIAEATADSQRDAETGEVPLRVEQVLKGKDLIKPGTVVRAVYYGNVEPGRRFMLSGVEPAQLMWSSPLPVDERAERYLVKLTELPEDDVERLRFFQQYLQDDSTMLARDAYDEFAIAPYEVVRKLKDDMDHDQLVAWIQDPEMPPDRRRLYLTMLGVCGGEADVPMLESMLRSTQKSARSGLDALIACYLSLAGRDGLPLVDELFLANSKAPYADTYGAIMAVRFHGTEGDVIPRSDLVTSLHHVLERPDLADLVIPDLARWGDWSQIDRLVELFTAAEADNNWIRVPVVNYLRACPLPEAEVALEKLEAIDPDAVKRANTFFTAPVPPAEKAPTTSDARGETSVPLAKVSNGSSRYAAAPLASAERLALRSPGESDVHSAGGISALAVPNRWRMLSVVATAAASLLIFGYLLICGGPQPRAELVRQVARR